MAEFPITNEETGDVYWITAESPEAAIQRFNEEYWPELERERVHEELARMPLGERMLQGADDSMRILADAMTFGLADRIAAGIDPKTNLEDQRQLTSEAKTRMPSLLQFPLEVGGMAGVAKQIPTAVGLGEAMVKNPIAKKVVGGGIAAGEGAAFGAGEALIRDEDVEEGAKWGAGGGILGKQLSDIIGGGARWIRNRKKMKADLRPDPVTAGTSRAIRRSAAAKTRSDAIGMMRDMLNRAEIRSVGPEAVPYDTALGSQIGQIMEKPKQWAMFPPEVQERLTQIRTGNLPTRAARRIDRFVHTPMGSSLTVGGGISGLIFNPLLTVAAGSALPFAAAGRGLINASAKKQGHEVLDVLKQVPKEGPLEQSQTRDELFKILRILGI